MANGAISVNDLVACTSPNTAADYLILGIANAASNTQKLLLDTMFENINNATANVVIITDNTTPANSTVTETQGRIWFDDDYLYVATSNGIKRVLLTTF